MSKIIYNNFPIVTDEFEVFDMALYQVMEKNVLGHAHQYLKNGTYFEIWKGKSDYIYNYFQNEVSPSLSPAIPRKSYLSKRKEDCPLCTEIKTILKTSETSTRLFHSQIVGQLSLHDYARAP